MICLTPALVVLVNNRRDWRRIRDEGWYRIPLKHAPIPVAADYLAFYFTRRFGRTAWQVPYYAAVRSYALGQRRLLLPDEPDHPCADDWYYKVVLGPVEPLPRPVLSRRLRRISFIPTTLERLLAADDVVDLWQTDEEQAVLWRYFPDLAQKSTRRLGIEERRRRYHAARRRLVPRRTNKRHSPLAATGGSTGSFPMQRARHGFTAPAVSCQDRHGNGTGLAAPSAKEA